MNIHLTAIEARVIGSLIEKARTTPEQYPLSLNALIAACNQKSSRDPVMHLSETEVRQVVDQLIKKRLISEKSGFGSRVTKFQHRFCNTDFGDLTFSEQELGIICVLLLRGPQTPGELRGRTERLCAFNDINEVEGVLERLVQREDGPFVIRLPREAGKRESRYMHLFCGEGEISHLMETAVDVAKDPDAPKDRLENLENEMQLMRSEIDAIKRRLDSLSSDPQ